jgi:hypothetical protein
VRDRRGGKRGDEVVEKEKKSKEIERVGYRKE